jgi:type I restriction enzyme S subunit
MIADLKPYPEYKESGLPWLGLVPDHWSRERAKWLFTKMARPVGDADDVVTCFRDGIVTLRKNRRLRGFTEAIYELGYQGIRKGDLVIHAMDAFAGAVGVSDSDGKATPVYAVCQPKSGVNAHYYAFIVREMARSQWILALSRGIRERSTDFRYDTFGGQRVPLPPPDEQAAIVRFLDWANGRLERAIRAKRKVIALLNEQKQAIIHRAVTRGLDPSVPLKDSGVPWLGEIPKHWEVRKVREIAQVVNGYPFDSRLFTLDRGHPLIRIRDLNKAATAVRFRGPFIEAARIQRGEVLIGMDGDFNVGTWGGDEDALLNQRMCCVRSRSPALNEYLRDALARPLREINELTYATTVKHLASSQVERISIGVPPRAELEDVVRYMRKQHLAYGERISRLEREITLLREYRTRLVADVVTGKLDVRAAAASLPDEAPLDDLAASRDPDDDALDTDDLTDTEADA